MYYEVHTQKLRRNYTDIIHYLIMTGWKNSQHEKFYTNRVNTTDRDSRGCLRSSKSK